jgi:tetratricopeptide (TPR) repeat protein
VSTFSISEAAQTAREKDQTMYMMYELENLNTYGFVLPIGSKVPEVHQLANDLQYSFFNYQDKSKYEEIAAKITELDPSYPSAYLMQSFYVPDDTPKYKELVAKAFELSKIHPLDSERSMVQADYHLLITEDYDQALNFFQHVADLYPESSVAIWCVGMVYYYSRQNKKALAAFEKSVELKLNLAKGYESISWIYSTKSDKEFFDKKKALEYLNIAIEKGASAANDQYYADHESYVYYLNGMYQKVISNIQHYYTFGDKYKESDTLKKVLQWSKEKLVETAMENK